MIDCGPGYLEHDFGVYITSLLTVCVVVLRRLAIGECWKLAPNVGAGMIPSHLHATT